MRLPLGLNFRRFGCVPYFFRSISRFESETANWPRLFDINHRQVTNSVSCFGGVWVVPWLLGKYFNIFKYSPKLAF